MDSLKRNFVLAEILEGKTLFEPIDLILSNGNIAFYHADTCYLITSAGIVELGTTQSYLPDSAQNSQIRYHGTWFRQPAYHMDNQEQIWVGFRYGEWGGDLFVFDTRQKRFPSLNFNGLDIELNPIQCICSNGDDIFVSTGLGHFTTSGSITRMKDYKINSILDSSPYSKVHRKDKSFNGEYIAMLTIVSIFIVNKAFSGVIRTKTYPISKNGKRLRNPV